MYMVQAMINISNEANQILNIVKAKHNLMDKSKAIETVILAYGKDMLEPELRPAFIEKMLRQQKEKPIPIGSLEDFKKRYGAG